MGIFSNSQMPQWINTVCAPGKALSSSERLRSLRAAASPAGEPDPADPRTGLVDSVHIVAAGRGRRRKRSLWCLPSIVRARRCESCDGISYVTCQISSWYPRLQLLHPRSALQPCGSVVSIAGSKGPKQSTVFRNKRASLVRRQKLSTESLKYMDFSLPVNWREYYFPVFRRFLRPYVVCYSGIMLISIV